MTTPIAAGEERRELSISTAAPAVRATEDGGQRFTGHAAVFDSRTAIGNPLRWGFYEQIAPGAFTKTLNEGDARFLLDHNSFYVVSRVSAETLSLAQDRTGLAVDSALDTRLSYVNDLITNLDNRNITGMSFGFYVVKDDWQLETVETSDGQTAEVEVRTLLEVRLIEVSAVTFPAYEDTDAGLRYSLVPALRHRGNADAIARVAAARPDLADLLPAPARDTGGVRSAVGSHKTDTDDGAWSASTQEKRLPADAGAATYKKVFAWQDPDADADTQAAWKFPHHFVAEDGTPGAASTKACTAGIAVLNGGRGGSGIPDADRQGVYAHLSKHLKDAGIEPAELNSAVEPGETTRGTEHDQHARGDEPAETTRPTYRELARRRTDGCRPRGAAVPA